MPNPNGVLITNPKFDTATEFGNLWMKEVINEAFNLGLNTIALEENDARLAQFQYYLAAKDPLLFIGLGHGAPEIFTGQNQEDLLWLPTTDYPGHEHADSNINLVQNRITYLLSCLTGRALGPAIAAQPNTYYIGYTEDFIFVGWDPGDIYSESFKLATNEIAKSLLRSESIEEAYNAGIRKFDEEIAKWQQSNDSSAPFIVSALLHDRDALIGIGAGITPPPEVVIKAPWAKLVTAGYGVIISLALI